MITPNNTGFLLGAKAAEVGFNNAEVDNNNLWKQALEKNGLYTALNKFQVISYSQKNNEKYISVNAEELGEIAPDKLHESSSDNYNFKKDFEWSHIKLKGSDYLADVGIKGDSRINVFNMVVKSQSFFNTLSLVSKNTVGVSKAIFLLNDIQWLHKNTLVSVIDSNLEIWLRDASLSGSKLNDVLRNIKQSMSDLGVSLSKVAVNGKVVFSKEK